VGKGEETTFGSSNVYTERPLLAVRTEKMEDGWGKVKRQP